MSVNLTQNTYNCFIEDRDTYYVERNGEYDRKFDLTLEKMDPSCRSEYENTFSRETLMRRFADGEREIYLELHQEGVDGEYHWLSVQMIRVEPPVDRDVLAIELVKLLDSQRAEKARQEQLLRDALAVARRLTGRSPISCPA